MLAALRNYLQFEGEDIKAGAIFNIYNQGNLVGVIKALQSFFGGVHFYWSLVCSSLAYL